VSATHAPLLGTVAGVLTVGSFLPQVVRAWRTKRTRDLSLGTFALLVTAGTLWMVYGALARDWPVVATNGGMVALNAALAVAKLRYR
jgi:MtN3 and saliva related transmembrane protein